MPGQPRACRRRFAGGAFFGFRRAARRADGRFRNDLRGGACRLAIERGFLGQNTKRRDDGYFADSGLGRVFGVLAGGVAFRGGGGGRFGRIFPRSLARGGDSFYGLIVSPLAIGLCSFPALIGMIFLRVPVGLAMLVCGLVGSAAVLGTIQPAWAQWKFLAYDLFSSHSLSIIPMFLLMGQFATRGGMSSSLFAVAEAFLRHRRGGGGAGGDRGLRRFRGDLRIVFGDGGDDGPSRLARIAQIRLFESAGDGGARGGRHFGGVDSALGGFGGVCDFDRAKHRQIVRGRVFAGDNRAGRLPRRRFGVDADGPRKRDAARARVGRRTLVGALRCLACGGDFYGGFGRDLLGRFHADRRRGGRLHRRRLDGGISRQNGLGRIPASGAGGGGILGDDFFRAVRGDGVQFVSRLFAPAADGGGVCRRLGRESLADFDGDFALLSAFRLRDGFAVDDFFDDPDFFPIVSALDFGLPPEEAAIWFGILVLVVVEVGLITPPVGLNLFIINRLAEDTPISETFRGVLPFIASDILRVAALAAFPVLSLWLPRMLF